FKGSFDGTQETVVKCTGLKYRLLRHKAVQLGGLSTAKSADLAGLAHVVVYDIVLFSQLEEADQRAAVRNLKDAVEQAFRAAGGMPSPANNELWYAPAGEGGAVVFHPNRGGGRPAVWTFTKALVAQASARLP